MKKRFLALATVLTMISSLILPTAVSAAVPWFHTESMTFEQWDTDIVDISMDIRKTEDLCYMFTLSSPKNEDDPYSTVTWMNLISFVLTSDGDLRASADGAWFSEETEGISVGKFKADGQWHNIRLKTFLSKRKIEMYLDDKLSHTFDISSRIGYITDVKPCNMVTISGDSTYKTQNGYEAKLSYAAGTNNGEMGVILAEHNTNNKTLNVMFTEELERDITNPVLKKTDVIGGEEEIPVSVKSRSTNKIVFEYSRELESSKEYVLILPDDVKGKNGEEPTLTHLYFTNVGISFMNTEKYSDYTTFNKDKDIKLQPGTSWNNRKANTYDGVYEIFSWQGPYAGGAQYWFSTLNWSEVDKAEIPTGGNVSIISFDIIPKKADMSYGFSLTHNVRNNNIKSNGLEISFDEAGNIIASCGVVSYGWSMLYTEDWADCIVGKYKVDEPLNIKYVIDKPNRTVQLYVDNELKKTVLETGGDTSQLYSSENSYLTLYEMFGHEGKNIYADRETLFLLDNVKLEVMKEVYSQPLVRFHEIDGSEKGPEKGPFDRISRKLDKVIVNFGREINESTLNSSTVKLSYNGVPVEYTVDNTSYDSKTFTYTIMTESIPGNGEKIEVECSGVKDETGNDVDSFRVYAIAGEDDGISVDRINVVDASGDAIEALGGELYADVHITNMTAGDKKVIVSFMGYANSVLKKLKYGELSVASGTKLVCDEAINPLSIDTTGIDRIEISVQDAETGYILSENYVYSTAENDGSVRFKSAENSVSAGEKVLVDVYAPEKGYADLDGAKDFRDVIVYKAMTEADESGAYEIAFDIDYQDAISGMYSVIAYGNKYKHTGKLLYVNPILAEKVLKEELLPALSAGDKDKAAGILLEYRYDLYIDDKYIDDSAAQKAAELLSRYEADYNITVENAETVINKAVAVAAFELDKIDDILSEAEIFDLDNSKIADYYEMSYVNQTTRDDITDRLDNKEFRSLDEFDDELTDAFILAVVANPVEPKSAMNVMKGLGLSGYTTSQYSFVSGKNYATISELKKALESNKSDSGGSSGGGGSSSGGKSQSIAVSAPTTAQTPQTPQMPQTPQTIFNDLDGVSWAEKAILALADMGIVNGKADGMFAPWDNVTREEFTKMIVSALNIKSEASDCSFTDVKSGEWYERYIGIACGAGIVKGYSNTLFGVGENITREDMAVMICRGAKTAGISVAMNDNILTEFADNDDISGYAKDSVYVLRNAGIINGKDGNMFAPKDFATRAEAAKMVYGLIAE